MMLNSAALIAATGLALAAAPAPNFAVDEAAQCAAFHVWTLQKMEGATNVPEEIRQAMWEGQAIWRYELSAAAPDADDATLQAAANRASAYVRAGLPEGENAEAAAARGDYLMGGVARCRAKIAEAYGDEEHPVIPFLREAEGVTVPAPPQAAPPQSASVEERPKPATPSRGLR
jgi:hypothetical protein